MPRYCAGLEDPSGGESSRCIFAQDGSGRAARVIPPAERCVFCNLKGLAWTLEEPRSRRSLRKWQSQRSPVLQQVFVASAMAIVGPEFFDLDRAPGQKVRRKQRRKDSFKRRFSKHRFQQRLRKALSQFGSTFAYPQLMLTFPKKQVKHWKGWNVGGLHFHWNDLLRVGLQRKPIWEIDGVKAVKEGLVSEVLPPEFVRRRQLFFREWYWQFSPKCRFCHGAMRGPNEGYCPRRECRQRLKDKLQALRSQRMRLEDWMVRKYERTIYPVRSDDGMSWGQSALRRGWCLENFLHLTRYGWHLGLVGILRDCNFIRMYACFEHVFTCPDSCLYNLYSITPQRGGNRPIRNFNFRMLHMPLFHDPVPLGFFFVAHPTTFLEAGLSGSDRAEVLRPPLHPHLHDVVCTSRRGLRWRYCLEQVFVGSYTKILRSDPTHAWVKDKRIIQWRTNKRLTGDFLTDARPLAAEREDCREWPRPVTCNECTVTHRYCRCD